LGSETGIQSTFHNLNKKVIDSIPASVDPPLTNPIIAKADSGASCHYFMAKDKNVLANLHATPFGPTVTLPNNTSIQATHAGQLPFHSSLSKKATTAHILDTMTNASLISLGQLWDDDCIAVLDKKKLQVFKNNTCVLHGIRNTTDGLWDVALPAKTVLPPSTKAHQLNAIIRKDLSKTQLVQYLYGCCGSPVIST
jgi:hypothetical protein